MAVHQKCSLLPKLNLTVHKPSLSHISTRVVIAPCIRDTATAIVVAVQKICMRDASVSLLIRNALPEMVLEEEGEVVGVGIEEQMVQKPGFEHVDVVQQRLSVLKYGRC